MLSKLSKITFPIIYDQNKITKKAFSLSVKKLQQRFYLDYETAYNLVSDMVKCLISENETPESLAHYVEGLSCTDWEFLREQSIEEVIASVQKPRKPAGLIAKFWKIF